MLTPDPRLPRRNLLQGKQVFLSASVPIKERSDKYQRVPNTAVSVEEAVIATSRAVFAAGGELIFGAHPSISPLVASVMREYSVPAPPPPGGQSEPASDRIPEGQPRIVMFQSDVWAPFWAENSKRLAEQPRVEVTWTPVMNNESVSPGPSPTPQAPHSMTEMRKQMFERTRPVAMIAIGGMDGTEEEAELFARLRPGYPIYALATTGGAAAHLAERLHIHDTAVIVPDRDSLASVMRFWKEQENRDPRRQPEESPREGSSPPALRQHHYYVPYSFIAQEIIAKIAQQNE